MKNIFENKNNSTAPKVFISYSYDCEQHEQWVEQLANQLRTDAGVNAIIDKFALNVTSDLNQIMIQGFKDSDKVVIVVTENYAKKAKELSSGVGYEMSLATILARRTDSKEKLIFIKRDNTDFDSVFPFQFKDYYAIDFSEDSLFNDRFKELYHKIWGKEFHAVAPIGKSPFDTQDTSGLIDITAETIYKLFDDNGFECYNLTYQCITSKSPVIWPVVPRQQVNIIHFAQIEVARVLALLGCPLKVIIANCGNNSNITPSREDVIFKESLEKVLKKKDITNYTISFLNEYYDPLFSNGALILSKFVKISSSVKISKLSFFNTKDESYDASAIHKVQDRTTLKYISPIFVWTASVYEAEQMSYLGQGSPIIIAGADEKSQWAHVFTEINSSIGAIFIPVLKQEDDKTIFQDTQKLFFSKKELEDKLGAGNIDKWLLQTFVYLASFPDRIRNLKSCNKTDCDGKSRCIECIFADDSVKFPDFINKRKFAELIYPKINPAQS
ncbi:toll/interleukin-1 receptor domain-containing protein [Bacteroides sp. AM10-21B]|uniref:toll/interleukin-1 receptor domain-containing protein n=1 Tax=Bacteroides sp. AM10-21B TaxID=2292001 RepID=UPI000E5564B6|nr:toll/interleukin-1 receptor domain-containing protein [Bacteroides sp. AM10-21B]RHJ53165.1 TIR domain-containing protein [Bacteroides sp. AM10-21B]